MTDSSDPFAAARRGSGVLRCPIEDEDIVMLLTASGVKDATKDFQTFSSDAPGRVPIPAELDIRSIRQLPIETDPPDHRDYRKLVLEIFSRPNKPQIAEKIRRLVDGSMRECLQVDNVESVGELALPLQSRALTVLLNVPLEHAEEWISWGTHVFRTDDKLDADKAAIVDEYIGRQLDWAATHPGEDFFSVLSRAQFRGRPLTRSEMSGFANLAFAGGRDTVINLISNILAWFARHPEALDELREKPSMIASAVEEFVRFFSPLSHIGRVVTRDVDIEGRPLKAGSRISLCWASANRDESVFDEPDTIRLDRHPNPHVGFGKGHHMCLGAQHARVVARSLLACLCQRVDRLIVERGEPILETFGDVERQVGFRRLHVRFIARD